MTCAGCGFDAAPDFAFCPKCGRPLSRSCPACAFVCAPGFAFCPKCGAGLVAAPPPATQRPAAAPAPGPEADRRLVTVLFADVSGFTALSERLDPEDVRAFQSDLFKMLGEAIEQ